MQTEKYELQGRDEYSFLYIEGDKYVIIEYEAVIKPFRIIIQISNVKYWTEPNGNVIDENKLQEIKQNCKEGWNFLNTPVEFR